MSKTGDRERHVIKALLDRIAQLEKENQDLRDQQLLLRSQQTRLEEKVEAVLKSSSSEQLTTLANKLCERDLQIRELEMRLMDRSGIIPAPIVARPSLLQRSHAYSLDANHARRRSLSKLDSIASRMDASEADTKKSATYRMKRTVIRGIN